MAPVRRSAHHRKQPLTKGREHYRAQRAHFALMEATRLKRSKSTLDGIERLRQSWAAYCCDIEDAEPLTLLRSIQKSAILNYMHWYLDHHAVKKRSTFLVHMRYWRLMYRDDANEKLEISLAEEMRRYITNFLAAEYCLDLSERPKPILTVDDLFQILHYHWASDTDTYPIERQRVQQAFLMLLLVYTASRPGAIIESSSYAGTNEALRYGNIRIRVVPDGLGRYKNVILMEVMLDLYKGRRETGEDCTFVLHEHDRLVFCPVLHFLALAFADDAFENSDEIRSLEDIYALEIRPPLQSIDLTWKVGMRAKPVFRAAVRTCKGWETSSEQALRYSTAQRTTAKLALNAGFKQALQLYALRRGAANVVNETVTVAHRNKIMGHRNPRTFDDHYLEKRIGRDIMNAYLGTPSEDALIRLTGRMSIDRDPRAPNTIAEHQRALIDQHHLVQELGKELEQLRFDLGAKYGRPIRKAQGSDLWTEYRAKLNERSRLRQQEHRRLSAQNRVDYFEKNNAEEIRRQFAGLSADYSPCQPDLTFQERARLAVTLYEIKRHDDENDTREARKQACQDMISLCRLCEKPGKKVKQNKMQPVQEEDLYPIRCAPTQCLFCLGNRNFKYSDQTRRFSRVDVMRAHVLKLHLRLVDEHAKLPCPHPSCPALLDNVRHFKNHAESVHNVKL